MIRGIYRLIKFIIRIVILLILVALVAAVILVVFPKEITHGAENNIITEKREAISHNCTTIKTQLRQLQRVDSRTRTYLGTNYETVLNYFIIPLNLRLVKNNRDTLGNIQSDYTELQIRFKNNYTDYMREMEGLLAIDCQTEPEEFYRHLQTTRTRRAALRESSEQMLALIRRQQQSVLKLQEGL